jgi:hypothetical protein
MPLPQSELNPERDRRQSLPKNFEATEESSQGKLPKLALEFQRYYILDALLQALPELGKSIARAHYYQTIDSKYDGPQYDDAKNKIRDLAYNPDAVASHEPWWHEYGIVTHTNKVVDVALNKWPELPDPRGDLAWAMRELSTRKIDGLSQLELLIISIPLHDIGKFQPVIKTWGERGVERIYHTGHEQRGGDIIAAARKTDLPLELAALRTIFNSFAITPKQLDYIEQCVRLHFEFGKVREAAAKDAGGYSVEYTRSPQFRQTCNAVAAEHKAENRSSDMSIEKGVLFLLDSAGKTNFEVQNRGSPGEWENHVNNRQLDPKLLNAYRQYRVNVEVGLRYLQILREDVGT